MFENFLLASGASDCVPDRHKAHLLHSLRVKGQRIFHTLPLPSSANANLGSYPYLPWGPTPEYSREGPYYPYYPREGPYPRVFHEDFSCYSSCCAGAQVSFGFIQVSRSSHTATQGATTEKRRRSERYGYTV
ncbi:hypothetical protein HPB48_015761 [Haemaphysalis longicornis]|uniref:Uncharacterized protein n=1 Tax=Haemaphysalis longicornis TaxID=44386 RepID=A0A9J6FQB3_HAELO|nr:hypothetical protein HPB48_015761 [Haemaphysalis longicornis]